MSKYLCTFPGKFGDILWSLPTAKYIAQKIVGCSVDFAVMPYYESVVPLIQEQEYIDRAFIIQNWMRTHSNYGDQPWGAPVPSALYLGNDTNYEKVWHLGYRCHPGRAFGNVEMTLIDFIAHQQGIQFNEWQPIPFIRSGYEGTQLPDVCYAFNEQYVEQKKVFLEIFLQACDSIGVIAWDLNTRKWIDAAQTIDSCSMFIGDRSSNWVIANGLGKECITYEPHPARNKQGHLGYVFSCPQGKEFALPLNMPPEPAAKAAASVVKQKVEQLKGVSVT